MAFYHSAGNIPQKRHIRFFKKDGKSLYREEHCSSRGFSGIYANKYHIHEPTRVLSISEINAPADVSWDAAPHQYYHFLTDEHPGGGDFVSARRTYLYNDHCAVSIAHVDSDAEYFFRNAYAHELIFVHKGTGTVFTEYGRNSFSPGDQIVIPAGTTYQVQFDDFSKNKLVFIESSTAFEIPRRYRNEYGQMLESAPYCERDLRSPLFSEPVDKTGEFRLVLKAGPRWFEHKLDHHPFDVVGWDGYLYPFVFNIRDFCPIVGKVHQPPPVHLVFETAHFVYCNFVPRLFDFHPEAIPIPYFHSNYDSDEVLYYVEGEFMSRSGVGEGSVTLHPAGMPHGPHPGKIEAAIGKKETKEYALMIDTFEPLKLTTHVRDSMEEDYLRSWLPG
ncbi:MAG: homogentisate 1,2-dioxygenase [Candidatus Marinimicrobia bacterium]|nr:homogentisate 1,2-dioxygenase [Candidatus Neomarinimicrobiota bacterium]